MPHDRWHTFHGDPPGSQLPHRNAHCLHDTLYFREIRDEQAAAEPGFGVALTCRFGGQCSTAVRDDQLRLTARKFQEQAVTYSAAPSVCARKLQRSTIKTKLLCQPIFGFVGIVDPIMHSVRRASVPCRRETRCALQLDHVSG